MTDTLKCDVCRLYLNDPHPECDARMAAYHKAADVFGEGAVVGFGNVASLGAVPVFYVGKTIKARFVYFGAGNDWAEAFRNVRRVLFHFEQRLILEALPEKKVPVAYDKQPDKPLT